jgi:hypothetical protein
MGETNEHNVAVDVTVAPHSDAMQSDAPQSVGSIPVAEPAPLATTMPDSEQPLDGHLPPQLMREWLEGVSQMNAGNVQELLPGLRVLLLAVVAGIALKISGGVLQAIDELPLLGGLLELVGLVSLIQFLSRNALQQQKRAALLARIAQLKRHLLD